MQVPHIKESFDDLVKSVLDGKSIQFNADEWIDVTGSRRDVIGRLANSFGFMSYRTKPEPLAELKAMYEQQVKNTAEGKAGGLEDFVWEFYSQEYPWWDDAGIPFFASTYQYRCTPKPTCQVRNLETGELKTMTREAAKLLQAENKDVCDWFTPHGSQLESDDDSFGFVSTGIYTYKQKANLVKLNGKLMSRESAIALWESKKDTCDVWIRSDINEWLHLSNPIFNSFEPSGVHVEYELRERPLKQIEWKDVPVGVMTNRGEFRGTVISAHGELLVRTERELKLGDTGQWWSPKDIELAPADKQPWIAVQDSSVYSMTDMLASSAVLQKLNI